MEKESSDQKNLAAVPHHKMGIKILDIQQLENLFPDYKSLLRRIEEHRDQIKLLNKSDKKIDSQYNLMYDNIFSIMGKRGSGKTSVALTLKQLFQEEENNIVLPIVMPEIIPSECSMIGWILSLLEEIVKQLDSKINANNSQKKGFFEDCFSYSGITLYREYNKVKELCFSQDYRVKGESFTTAVIDKEQQAQNSFNFSKELVKFWDIFVESVRETCESPKANEPLIFIIFDDVDLMPDEVINLLSTIIKYLSHPNIIVLVTADEALLYDVIENSMNNKLGKYSEVSKLPEKRLLSVENAEKMAMQLNQKLSIIREIPKLYGDKILPPSCRYYLRSFTHCREKGRFIERVRK